MIGGADDKPVFPVFSATATLHDRLTEEEMIKTEERSNWL